MAAGTLSRGPEPHTSILDHRTIVKLRGYSISQSKNEPEIGPGGKGQAAG